MSTYDGRVTSTPDRVRLAELVATISLGTDLGLGQPMEHVLRHTLVSLRMAELLELDVAERNVAYYSGLLCWVGCHTDAYEQAKWFGDDIAAKRDGFRYDQGRATHALAYGLRNVGAGHSPLTKARLWATLPFAARQNALIDLRNHWLAADELTRRLGLGDDVRQSLKESFERWDGKGAGGVVGDEVRLTSRLVILADVVTAFYASGGLEAAVTVARQRSGTQLDPELVDLFCRHSGELMAGLDQTSNWDEVLAAEPSLSRTLSESELNDALRAMGDFADIKSPFTIGHSTSVADLAWAAAVAMDLSDDERVTVRRAAWVHDIGRLGVPNSIWDKPGPLSRSETERVRLHPYLTERMLAGTPMLARLGRHRGAASRASRWLRLPPRPRWRCRHDERTDTCLSRHLRRPDRTATAPKRDVRRRRGSGAQGTESRLVPSTPTPRAPYSRQRDIARHDAGTGRRV